MMMIVTVRLHRLRYYVKTNDAVTATAIDRIHCSNDSHNYVDDDGCMQQ